MVLGPHTARGNVPHGIAHCVEWQTGLVRFMLDHGYNRVEPKPEHVAEWTETVLKISEPLLAQKVDSCKRTLIATSTGASSGGSSATTDTRSSIARRPTPWPKVATRKSASADVGARPVSGKHQTAVRAEYK